MEQNNLILFKKNNEIAIIYINRPRMLNALNANLLLQLNKELDKIQNNHKIKVIIFIGIGNKAFCSGADLKERSKMNYKQTNEFINLINKVFNTIEDMPIPTIAAINGIAFGGGLELALSCDIRVMTEDTTIGLTECSLGIIPGAGGTQRLAKIVGLSVAKEMIFCAKKICTTQAYKIGLISKISKNSKEALNVAINIAEQITKNAPLSILAAKRAINDGFNLKIKNGLKIERKFYNQILQSKDRQEGINSFNEKRSPKYQGC